jgi:hypothetical protein
LFTTSTLASRKVHYRATKEVAKRIALASRKSQNGPISPGFAATASAMHSVGFNENRNYFK